MTGDEFDAVYYDAPQKSTGTQKKRARSDGEAQNEDKETETPCT